MKLRYTLIASLVVAVGGLYVATSSMYAPPSPFSKVVYPRTSIYNAELGGKQASIPREFLRLMELRDDSTPERPIIASFMYEFRFQDGVIYKPEHIRDVVESRQGKSKSIWISVGVNAYACPACTGDLYRTHLNYKIKLKEANNKGIKYQNSVQSNTGLTKYTPEADIDITTHAALSEADTFFYKENDKHNIVTLIRCANRPRTNSTCSHKSTHWPETELQVSARYPGELLPHWESIERTIKSHIESFYPN